MTRVDVLMAEIGVHEDEILLARAFRFRQQQQKREKREQQKRTLPTNPSARHQHQRQNQQDTEMDTAEGVRKRKKVFFFLMDDFAPHVSVLKTGLKICDFFFRW